jgi:hypothetical protein
MHGHLIRVSVVTKHSVPIVPGLSRVSVSTATLVWGTRPNYRPRNLVKRGLPRPELLIVDGDAGLESAIAAVWGRVPVQRCTVHKHHNLPSACMTRYDLRGHTRRDRIVATLGTFKQAPDLVGCVRKAK